MADVRGTTAGNLLNAVDGVTNGADEIFGRGGDDTVFGLGGDDLIADGAWSGGPARSPYNFFLHGFSTWSSGGNDTFNGGGGDDRLIGDGGDDTLNGDGDNDTLIGGQGDDTLNGGSGDDTLVDDTGNETINGGSGTDTVRFSISGSGDAEPSDSEPLFPIGVKGVFADMEAGRSGFAFDNAANNRIFNVSYTSVETFETSSTSNQRDEIRGDDTSDTIRTFGGDDLVEGRGGADTLDGGAGNDTASYVSSREGVNVFLSPTAIINLDDSADAFGDVLLNFENLSGSRFGDFLTGDAGVNILNGNDGADTLRGGAGADRLEGGTNSDTAEYGGLFGSDAGVVVSTDGTVGSGGHAAGDRLIGVENINGSNFSDVLTGDDSTGNGLTGANGNDTLTGRGGDDILSGGSGFNRLEGDAGTDTASYRDATSSVSLSLLDFGSGGSASATGRSDTLFSIENADGSESGDDFLGSVGANRLRGFGGADALHGFGGIDSLFGGDGDDLLNGGLDGDLLSGSTGIDTATYRLAGAGVELDLDTGGTAGEALGDTFFSVENVIGSTRADIIFGNAEDNALSGSDGDDKIAGEGGDDTLSGGDGADSLSGDGDNDTISGGSGGDILDGGDGQDAMNGGADDDFMSGRAGDDTMDGGTGNDAMNGGADNDTADGGAGNDTVSGGAGGDTLRGGDGEDLLSGDEGADTVEGGGGEDLLLGGAGNDTLDGGSENDVLIGGGGADALIGGAGSDTASYEGATARVRVALNGSFAGEGDALGDTFASINRVTGTSLGDVIRGDDNGNVLRGDGGADTLQGQGGVDSITGGAGADALTGGSEGDFFNYLLTTDGGDTIRDFSNLLGNDDTLRFDNAGFGNLALGILDPSLFEANATGLATAAATRFIYETDTGILTFDANGSAAGGATLIATLEGTPVLTAGDILII